MQGRELSRQIWWNVVEDASRRVEDIRRVVDYLITLPYVKVDSIGCSAFVAAVVTP